MTIEGQNTPVSTPSGPSAGLEGQDATQEETPDATEAAQRRVERYAEALWRGCRVIEGEAAARAAIAVADQEQAELREQAREQMERVTLHAVQREAELRAEVERLRKPTVAAVMGYELGAGDLERAEARVAELEAIVARVRAKVDGRIPLPYCQADSRIIVGLIRDLRAILDAPKDTTETPCPTCSGPSRETVGMVCQTCGTDYAPKDTTAP